MIRILHLVKTLDPVAGGVPVAVSGLASAQARAGATVHVWSFDRFTSQSADPFVHRSFRRTGWEKLDYSRAMLRSLRQRIHHYDAVHSHLMYSATNPEVLTLCQETGKPFFISPHGMLAPYMRSRHKFRKAIAGVLFNNGVLNKATRIHFTTLDEAHLAEPWGLGDQTLIIPLGVNAASLARQVPSESFLRLVPGARGKKILLYLGRLNFKKGLDILVEAYRLVKQDIQDVHLVIVGPDDGMEATTRRLVESHGLQEHVTFLGMADGDVKVAAFQSAYCFVLPSYTENFGIAVFEAVAAGCPPVISDQVGVWREVVENGLGLAAPCEAQAYARQLSRLLANPGLRETMSKDCVQYARTAIDWAPIADRFLGAYSAASGG